MQFSMLCLQWGVLSVDKEKRSDPPQENRTKSDDLWMFFEMVDKRNFCWHSTGISLCVANLNFLLSDRDQKLCHSNEKRCQKIQKSKAVHFCSIASLKIGIELVISYCLYFCLVVTFIRFVTCYFTIKFTVKRFPKIVRRFYCVTVIVK